MACNVQRFTLIPAGSGRSLWSLGVNLKKTQPTSSQFTKVLKRDACENMAIHSVLLYIERFDIALGRNETKVSSVC